MLLYHILHIKHITCDINTTIGCSYNIIVVALLLLILVTTTLVLFNGDETYVPTRIHRLSAVGSS